MKLLKKKHLPFSARSPKYGPPINLHLSSSKSVKILT